MRGGRRLRRAFPATRLLSLLALLGSAVVFAPRSPAAPPEADPFPEVGKRRGPEREPTPWDRAVDQAAARLGRSPAPGMGPEAVEFALWLYSDRGRPGDRERAATWARAMAEDSLGGGAVGCLYRVAQAGGATRGEADAAYRSRQAEMAGLTRVSTVTFARFVEDGFARAAATGDASAIGQVLLSTGDFWQLRTRQEGNRLRVFGLDGATESLAGHTAALRVGLEAAALSGSPPVREECRLLGHEMLKQFWTDAVQEFRDPRGKPDLRHHLLAALAVWEVGMMTGDALLTGRGRRAVESRLDAALADPATVAVVGLAAGRMGRHPVQMALVGEAADPTLVSLRQAAYAVFEPSKLLLNLDPAVDAARFAELLYPPDLAPALFICVETVCSPPLTSAEDLAGKTAEIRKLAGDLGD